VLRDVARGRPNLPPPGIETMNPVTDFAAALHAAFFGLLVYLCATTPLLGDGGLALTVRYAGLGAVVALYPASAAVLGITNSLAASLDPRSFGNVIAVLRWRYGLLLGMCALLALAVGVTLRLVGAAGLLSGVLGQIVSCWAALALFALIGVAIHAQRDDFDMPADLDRRADRDWQDRERVWKQALDRAYVAIRSGFVEEGYATVKQLIGSERDSLDVYQWTFNAMLTWQEQRHALELGRRFVVRLVEEKRARNALALLDQCRKLSPSFAIPPEAAALSDYARAIGRPRLAEELAAAAQR
jgi:hypothetical protein